MSEHQPVLRRGVDVHTLALMAVLVAIEIVLSRFLSFSVWNMKIGFAFVPVVVAAVLLGPVRAGAISAVADFLGAVLFPIGTYFPGFTCTAFLTGMVFGLFLHPKITVLRIAGAVGINQLVLGLFVNTLWISILYASPYSPLLLTRLTQCAILIPVQMITIGVMARTVIPFLRRTALARAQKQRAGTVSQDLDEKGGPPA